MQQAGRASVAAALRSRPTVMVALLSFSSGLPLGLILYAIPDWMRSVGVDLRVIGALSLAQSAWAFKVGWAPLVDRFAPPFWGRRRGWIAITQVLLAAGSLLLAGLGQRPDAVWVIGAVALAIAVTSATQDIALDAYAVEVLRPDEQGVASGLRAAVYRVGMVASGGMAITAAAALGWPAVHAVLALTYLLLLALTRAAPTPARVVRGPRSLRDAVWLPLVDALARPRAVELLVFVVLYKLSDHLAQALAQAFFVDMGYTASERGAWLATVSAVSTLAGTMLGGFWTTLMGLGPALWIFGVLQVCSNIGYVVLARLAVPHAPLLYAAASFEQLTSGLGAGAFAVFLMRLTNARFSATQYALFSSLFALPRALAGPVAGAAADTFGWAPFFLATMFLGLPGLIMLARVAPLGVRDPVVTNVGSHPA